MLADDVGGGVTLSGTLARRLEIIELLYELGEALLKQLLTGDPGVETMIQAWQIASTCQLHAVSNSPDLEAYLSTSLRTEATS